MSESQVLCARLQSRNDIYKNKHSLMENNILKNYALTICLAGSLLAATTSKADQETCDLLKVKEYRNLCNLLHDEVDRSSLTGGHDGNLCGWHQKKQSCEYLRDRGSQTQQIEVWRNGDYAKADQLNAECRSLTPDPEGDNTFDYLGYKQMGEKRECRAGHKKIGGGCHHYKYLRVIKCRWSKREAIEDELWNNSDILSTECKMVDDTDRTGKPCRKAWLADVANLSEEITSYEAHAKTFPNLVELHEELADTITDLILARNTLSELTVSEAQAERLTELTVRLEEEMGNEDSELGKMVAGIADITRLVYLVIDGSEAELSRETIDVVALAKRRKNVSSQINGLDELVRRIHVRLGELRSLRADAQHGADRS